MPAPPSLLPGIGPKTSERLARMGVRTIAELCAQPEDRLRAAFGERQGLYLRRRAQFEDEGPLAAIRETKSQSSETTFDEDVADRSEHERVIERLSSDLCARLERRGLRGRTVAVKVRLDDWTTVTRARTVEQPTNELATVASVALSLLRAYDPPRPVRLLGVRVAAFEREPEPADEDQLALPL